MERNKIVNWQQIKALLRKDYLVRLRQPWMTAVQIAWPMFLFLALYVLRFRYGVVDVPTCQYPSRQLPMKTSVLPFFQSYICTVANECLDPEKYEEITTFPKAPITPVLNIVQTFMNEPTLFDMILNLPTSMNFMGAAMTVFQHPTFNYLQENVDTLTGRLSEYQELIGDSFDIQKIWSDDVQFASFGNALCAKPFPKSNQIRFVESVFYHDDYSGPDKDELDAMPTKYCKQLFLDVTNTNHGKLTWYQIKPIIQGKIVYGPGSADTEEIMSHVNGTFEGIDRLKKLFGGISNIVTGLRTDEKFRNALVSVVQLAKSPFIQTIVGSMSIDMTLIDALYEGLIHDATIPIVLDAVQNILECFSTDRFVPVTTADELETVARALHEKKLFYAGIFFDNGTNVSGVSKDIAYTIRMDVDNTPKTIENRNRFWFPGAEGNFVEEMRYHRGFIEFQYAVDTGIIKWLKKRQNDERKLVVPPPSEPVASDSGFVDFSDGSGDFTEEITEHTTITPIVIGFGDFDDNVTAVAPLDDELEEYLNFDDVVDVVAPVLNRTKRAPQISELLSLFSAGSPQLAKPDKFEVDELKVYTKQFPYPMYRHDDFKNGLYLSQFIQIVFFFGLLLQIAAAVRYRIWMKESGNRKLMHAMGLLKSSDLIAWTITTMLELMFIFVMCMVILYGGGILQTTNIIFILIFLFVYGLSVLAFCYMTSSFYSSASLGSVSATIIFLMTFLPYIIIISLGTTLSLGGKIIVNLSLSTAFCYAWQHIMRNELQQLSLGFGNAFDGAFDSNDLKLSILMLIVDACLYALAGYLCERYMDSEYKFHEVAVKDMDESIGAAMVKVTKSYDTDRPAIDSVSVEFLRDHITCLLGRNGAGKSTIIKLLTGQIRASSGEVYLPQNVNHITGDEVTEKVGLCPQSEVLLPNLTAKEHLQLYASIKLPNGPHEPEVQRIMESLDFGKYDDFMAENLSGGFRRRLNIGIAFIGSPNLVILDEPCSSIDTKTRKSVWQTIEALRKGRAVILATHYLDEAELLSDQVLILNEGVMVGEFSPKSLRDQFTKSFDLHIELPPNATDPAATDALKQQLRDHAALCTITDVPGPGLRLTVPYNESIDATTDFSPLIRFVEDEQHEKRVRTFKVISQNLEGMFHRLIKSSASSSVDRDQNTVSILMNDNNPSVDHKVSLDDQQIELPIDNNEQLNKPNKAAVIRNLFWKRLMHFKRNYRLILCVLILPVIFEVLAMSFMKMRPLGDYDIDLNLSTALYPNATTFKTIENTIEFSEKIAENLHCDPVSCKYLQTSEDAYKWLLKTNSEYKEKRFGGISVNQTTATVWYNNKGYHSMPAFLNKFSSATLKAELNDDEINISTYNHPLTLGRKELNISSILQQVADAGISIVLLVAFSLVVAGASVYIVNERTSGEKLQQQLCGVSFGSYWGVAYLWDLMIYCIALLLALVVLKLFGLPAYTARDNLAGVGLLLLMFGLACIPMVHVCEKLFGDPSLANMNILCLNVIISLATRTIIILFDFLGETDATEEIRNVLNRLFMVFPQHALADGLIEICKNHILANIFTRFAIDTYQSPIASTLLLTQCIFMFVFGIVFGVTNYLIESGIWHGWFQRKKDSNDNTSTIKPSTSEAFEKYNDAEPYVLRVTKLCKTYAANHHALKNVSFHVNGSECFGLLGANGAGKSTIFSILSGQLYQTAGDVQFFDNRGISYCPQTNALDQLLTVEEIIHFYGTLKRIPDLEALTTQTLRQFHLEPYRLVLVKNLSGGNQRKLSVAVTCFGNTSLVLMDEPTSDMDPITRSLVYKSIHALLRSKRSVVLTSHTITEIDRVCNRIGVMRDGEMIAMGPVAQLKSMYGNSYVGTVFYDATEVAVIEKDLKAAIPILENLKVHNHCMQFTVRIKANQFDTQNTENVDDGERIALSDLFAKLHQLACTHRIVYTISECLLDQAFERVMESKQSDQAYINNGFMSNES